MTNPEFFNWRSQAGLKIFAQAWVPTQVLGAVALVHGLGEHSGRYAHVAQSFNDHCLVVVAFDLPGHGRSEGKRGVTSFQAIFDEIDTLLDEIRRRFPNKPVFLYGHSLGASAGLQYILQRKPGLKGAIITSPALAAVSVSPLKFMLARYLSHIAPTITLGNGLVHSHLSRDAQIVAAYDADPLVHTQVSTSLGWDLLSVGSWILNHAAELTLPLLLVHGTADQVCRFEGSEQFSQRAPAGFVTLKLWDGLYHETHNEPEKVEVLAYILSWIAQQSRLENGILASASSAF